MDAYAFQFTAKQLRAIPSRHLGFLIASGHCSNELAILLPYILFEHHLKDTNDTEAAFILTRRYTIDRIIVSKIVEYGDLCARYFNETDGRLDPLLSEFSNNFEPIFKKLHSSRWARIMRNKISFHYDRDYSLAAVGKLDDDHPLKLIVGRIKGITLFDFAEEIVARPTFEEAGGGDIGRGMDVANKFIVDLVGAITSFHARATISMFKAFGMLTQRIKMDLGEQYCGDPDKIRIPLSLSSEYVASLGGPNCSDDVQDSGGSR